MNKLILFVAFLDILDHLEAKEKYVLFRLKKKELNDLALHPSPISYFIKNGNLLVS